MAEIIYPKLSYEIVGCLFEVYKNIGANHRENIYQNALAKEFAKNKIKFREQYPIAVKYKDSKVGQNFFDFLIEDKIILEVKLTPRQDRGASGQLPFDKVSAPPTTIYRPLSPKQASGYSAIANKIRSIFQKTIFGSINILFKISQSKTWYNR